jgi:hypothetical protein
MSLSRFRSAIRSLIAEARFRKTGPASRQTIRRVPVSEAARQLEERGLLKRWKGPDQSDRIIPYVEELLGRPLPPDLVDFYRERIESIGDFGSYLPVWNDHVGWRTDPEWITRHLDLAAVELFSDSFGNAYVLDLSGRQDPPGVYLVDHDYWPARLDTAMGSSLGAFLLVIGEETRAGEANEIQPPRWELAIDPDIEKCARAGPSWFVGDDFSTK